MVVVLTFHTVTNLYSFMQLGRIMLKYGIAEMFAESADVAGFVVTLLQIAAYLVVLLYLCRESILHIYAIPKRAMMRLVIGSAVAAILVILLAEL
jgi:hypothetical protein